LVLVPTFVFLHNSDFPLLSELATLFSFSPDFFFLQWPSSSSYLTVHHPWPLRVFYDHRHPTHHFLLSPFFHHIDRNVSSCLRSPSTCSYMYITTPPFRTLSSTSSTTHLPSLFFSRHTASKFPSLPTLSPCLRTFHSHDTAIPLNPSRHIHPSQPTQPLSQRSSLKFPSLFYLSPPRKTV
jgi:hypothetical protein